MAGCEKSSDAGSDKESGSQKDSGKGSFASDSDISGTYFALEGIRKLGIEPARIATEYDLSIKEAREYFSSNGDDEIDFLNKKSAASLIKLDEGGDFEVCYQPGGGSYLQFFGKYSRDGGVLSFKYEHEKKTITQVAIQKLDTPQVTESDAGEGDMGERLTVLNTAGEGSYLTYAAPVWYAADFIKFDSCILPMPMGMRSLNDIPLSMQEEKLKNAKKQYFTVHGGVLCTDTAGWTLKDSYTKGGSFTVDFDCFAAADDWYYYNSDNEAEKYRDMLKTGIKSDGPSTIEFSSGKWVWKRDSGDVINTGSYTESDEIDGLFCMYTDSSSEHKPADTVLYQFIYINGSQVYYPYAVRI